MGVLTDFVVADLSDAKRVCDSSCPSKEFAGVDAKGVSTVMLGKLFAILTKTDFDPSFIGGEELLSEGGDDGPWVFRVPDSLVQQVSTLDEGQRGAVATEWAKTEEFSPKYGNWPADAVSAVLEEFAKLCRQAVNEGKSVMMWLCL